MKWRVHQGRIELFFKTIDEAHAALQRWVKREHLGEICLISVFIWMHPLFRFLLVLRVTSRIGQARACLPLACANSIYQRHGEGSQHTFCDARHAFLCLRAESADRGSWADRDAGQKVLLQFSCAHTCMQTQIELRHIAEEFRYTLHHQWCAYSLACLPSANAKQLQHPRSDVL